MTMEDRRIVQFWSDKVSDENYLEPSFRDATTVVHHLMSQMCCLYLVYTNTNDETKEALVMVGQDYLDTISGDIEGFPKTSHVKTLEYFETFTNFNGRLRNIIGFYFDSLNGKFDSCANGIKDSFQSRAVTDATKESLDKKVLPLIRQQIMANNVRVRCNGYCKDKTKSRCKRYVNGTFYCGAHTDQNMY